MAKNTLFSITGLTNKEAEEKRSQFGLNKLQTKKKKPLILLFFAQFCDLMILILLIAAFLSAAFGEFAEALTILSLVLLNALLGFVQEAKTEKTLEKLSALGAPKARVLREGAVTEIDPALLVPSDLVFLETGDKIPADGVLLASSALATDESILTGESCAEEKCALTDQKIPENKIGCKERAFMGTTVVRGQGKLLITHTGMQTQMGCIANLLEEVKEGRTPLQRKLEKLGKILGALCLGVCFLVGVLGFLRGEEPLQMLITALSLAVAAVPEGLPSVVTLSLALATNRMLGQKVLLRRLHLVETLGSANVICTDKTGTLTENKMHLTKLFTPKGTTPEKGHPLRKALALSNRYYLEPTLPHTNPTEEALFLAADSGFSGRLLAQTPFDSNRKRMSLWVEIDGKRQLFVKGAPDILLSLCDKIAENERAEKLDGQKKKALAELVAGEAKRGARLLAFATGESEKEENLTLLGFAALEDPPRKGTKEAVKRCKEAGIRTIMITGDAKETALAVAKEVGITQKDNVLCGSQLDGMDENRLQAALDDCSVFARVTPAHKLQILRALKKSGAVTAMTGDGVNDAPAIKEADIGIAMGKSGSDVTKEAADMLLLDDAFATITRAVKEGRAVYDNIRRFIRYLLSCNLGEVLSMTLAMFFGMPTLLLPIQILFVNFVTDGLPALALGLEPPEEGIMRRPPRKSSDSLLSDKLGVRIFFRGWFIALSTLFSFQVAFLQTASLETARTAAMTTLVLSQLVHALECKSEAHSLLKVPLFSSKKLLAALLFSFCLLLAALYFPPAASLFSLTPLPVVTFAGCLAFALFWPILAMVAEGVRGTKA